MQATRTLALAGMIAPVLFVTLVIVQGALAPDYSHVTMPISALTAWPTGWIQKLNFHVFGGSMAAFAFGLHRNVQPTRGGAAGFALLAIGGAGIVAAGVFPWKMVDGVPTETPLHVAAAIPSFAATAAGLIVFSRRLKADPRWRDLAAYTLSSGIVMLLLFVTLGWFAHRRRRAAASVGRPTAARRLRGVVHLHDRARSAPPADRLELQFSSL